MRWHRYFLLFLISCLSVTFLRAEGEDSLVHTPAGEMGEEATFLRAEGEDSLVHTPAGEMEAVDTSFIKNGYEANTNEMMSKATIEDIISDIYAQLNEEGEVSFEDVEEKLIELAENPININNANFEDLQQLLFLNPHQIDAILLHIYKHPLEDKSELRTISCLPDYIIRNMLPFITIVPKQKANKLRARDFFRYGHHEILLQGKIDECEEPIKDHINTLLKYKYNYKDILKIGAVVQYNSEKVMHGEYIQIGNIGCLKNAIIGNYKASIGLGLVLGDPFYFKDRSNPLNVGQLDNRWARYNSSAYPQMHGAAATLTFGHKNFHINASALYSINERDNYTPNRKKDTIRQHTIGANVTMFYKQLQVGLTVVENIYTDSVRYYNNQKYNHNYFRGRRQNIAGVTFRYNFGKADVFGEAAGGENKKYGYAVMAGTRYYPVEWLGLMAMYRYFSPDFHNTWSHSFSAMTQINDESGIYFGADFNYLRRWSLSLYSDWHKFSDYKYRINYYPSYGFDIQLNSTWRPNRQWTIKQNFRAREKAKQDLYSSKLRVEWSKHGWQLRLIGDVSVFSDSLSGEISDGYSIIQDVQYSFKRLPMVLQTRFQYFNVDRYDNRIYNYEKDILYAFSSPFAYGKGWTTYLNMSVRVLPFWLIYLRVRETIYANSWKNEKKLQHKTKTDVHLLLRFLL